MFLISLILTSCLILGWGIYWSFPHEKNIKSINWEKMGVFLGILIIVVMFGFKINDLSERIAAVEGKLQILIENKILNTK